MEAAIKHTMSDRLCFACGANGSQRCKMPERLARNQLTWEEFEELKWEWSQRTFGTAEMRGPMGPLKHLVKEIEKEIMPAIADGSMWLEPGAFVFEFADVMFLALDAARRAGFPYHRLMWAMQEKLKVNMARKWPPPTKENANEAIEHDRSKDPVQAADSTMAAVNAVRGIMSELGLDLRQPMPDNLSELVNRKLHELKVRCFELHATLELALGQLRSDVNHSLYGGDEHVIKNVIKRVEETLATPPPAVPRHVETKIANSLKVPDDMPF